MLKFPSPLGASYFQIYVVACLHNDVITGFRPLSGHLISKSYIRSFTKEWTFSFRPLSGHLISKFYKSVKD